MPEIGELTPKKYLKKSYKNKFLTLIKKHEHFKLFLKNSVL
jgi:hypothetical protein